MTSFQTLHFPLPPTGAGASHQITAFRYGTEGARPKAYIQAGLHADEFPGMLALHILRPMLERAAERGLITGEILILPQANPLGLTQHPNGFLYGRHEAESGENSPGRGGDGVAKELWRSDRRSCPLVHRCR